MNHLQQAALLHVEAEVLGLRIEQIERLDVDENFATIVTNALKADLGKKELLAELPCSWSTVTRWAAGHVKPARIARRAIKAKLVEMLDCKRREYADEARRLEEAQHLVAA